MTLSRRQFLAASATASLAGCDGTPALDGGFAGLDIERGHALRAMWRDGLPTPARVHRTRVVIAGGGVAGLSAARGLRLRGVQDFVVLELEDAPGGNSRGTHVGGLPCPMGAHYLPVPGDDAPEVQDLLEELGLRRRVAGRWQYDERHLCHSPQERLYFQGEWQEGLLPVTGVEAATLAQYQRFSERVGTLGAAAHFAMPVASAWGRARGALALHLELDRLTMAEWLRREGFTDALLLGYLDYCCRDDYGAGIAHVSAWAGIHYFASRHGFRAPGADLDEPEGVLTWPEGNGWLTQRLAQPLQGAGQLRTGCSVVRIAQQRQGVTVDVWDHASGQLERWQADHAIVALPVWLAVRIVDNPPDMLRAAARQLTHAPWVVCNLHLDSPLADRPGAAPAWDNVLHADPNPGGLGYVNAGHQRLDPRPAPTVLTYYRALGDVPGARAQIQRHPWQHWAEAAIEALSVPHPDLRGRLTRVAVTRYGHAMAVPRPGSVALLSRMASGVGRGGSWSGRTRAAAPGAGRISFAHADWSGYSVFEEAMTRGHQAAQAFS